MRSHNSPHGQHVILLKTQPFGPALVDQKIVRLFRGRRGGAKRSIDRVVTVPVDVVAAGKADIICPQFDAENDI